MKLENVYHIMYYENDDLTGTLKTKAAMGGTLSTFTLMDLQEQIDNDEITVVEINERGVAQ